MQPIRRQFLKSLVQSAAGLAVLMMAPPIFSAPKRDDFSLFMDFSHIITAQNQLDPAFGALCWRTIQQKVQLVHLEAMHHFLEEANPTIQTQMLKNDTLKFMARQTLAVWYKGDLTGIPHTQAEGKIAYLNALQWKAIGIPARGVCVVDWSKACTT